MKVRAYPVKIGDRQGYDLRVIAPDATVQDYLNALNYLIESGGLDRTRAEVSTCEGCSGCCAERIPLTSIDVTTLMDAGNFGTLFHAKNLNEFLGPMGKVIVEGKAVDIILGATSSGYCVFLDQEKKLCRIYPYRPLVCQTFICAPHTYRAKALRDKIVNTGEDQLVREWLLEAETLQIPPLIHLGDDPEPDMEDWPQTPFEGKKGYNKVRIKDLCNKNLWQDLCQPLAGGDDEVV